MTNGNENDIKMDANPAYGGIEYTKGESEDRYRCDHTTGGLVHGIGGIIMHDEAEGTA